MTPEQALAYLEQERLDVLAEGHTEEDCNQIAGYVLASAYRKLAAARSETVAPKFPTVEATEFNTIYIGFKEEKDGDLAKNVRRRVDACIDVDAAGDVIGIELFDLPIEQYVKMQGDK